MTKKLKTKKRNPKVKKPRNPGAQDVPLRYYQAHGKRIKAIENELRILIRVVANMIRKK